MNALADFNAGTRRAIDTYQRENRCRWCGAFIKRYARLTAPRAHCSDACKGSEQRDQEKK